jgi:hypothetical protein
MGLETLASMEYSHFGAAAAAAAKTKRFDRRRKKTKKDSMVDITPLD